MGPTEGSLLNMIIMLENEAAAEKILKLMREQHPSVLVLCNEEHPTEAINDMVCQHLAELGLKEILDTLKSTPIGDEHLFAGCVLVSIKDIHIVKKYMWKDKQFVRTLSTLLKHPDTSAQHPHAKMFRDIGICALQGLLFGGTPRSVLEAIAASDIIETYTDILRNRKEVTFRQSYDKLILSLLVMSQDNIACLQKCKEFETADALGEFSCWEQLADDEMKEKSEVASQCIHQMSHKDELPEHKQVILDKFSGHMQAKNKTYKRMETVKCSSRDCSNVETDTRGGRFKKCGRCRVVVYCSKECQRVHWVNGHAELCAPPTGSGDPAGVD